MPKTTRITLLERVRDPRDQAAWEEFDARYRELILRYCRSRGLGFTDSEDVCQAVMLGLSRALRSFRYTPERGRFRSYLGRAVQNAVHLHFRRHGEAPEPLDAVVLDALADAPPERTGAEPTDGDWEREWMNHHLRIAMRTIRETHNAKSVRAFDLLLAGRSAPEVGELVGLSHAAVRKIKQRIGQRLSELVAEQLREEGEVDV